MLRRISTALKKRADSKLLESEGLNDILVASNETATDDAEPATYKNSSQGKWTSPYIDQNGDFTAQGRRIRRLWHSYKPSNGNEESRSPMDVSWSLNESDHILGSDHPGNRQGSLLDKARSSVRKYKVVMPISFKQNDFQQEFFTAEIIEEEVTEQAITKPTTQRRNARTHKPSKRKALDHKILSKIIKHKSLPSRKSKGKQPLRIPDPPQSTLTPRSSLYKQCANSRERIATLIKRITAKVAVAPRDKTTLRRCSWEPPHAGPSTWHQRREFCLQLKRDEVEGKRESGPQARNA